MPHPLIRSIALAAAVLAAAPAPLLAQDSYGTSAASVTPAPFAQEELDSLLAPIALYPDQLLAQVLMAATFPLDVVEAARFVKERPGLKGAALDSALANKPWDPSVLSLAAFPQVLEMMNDHLDWTRRLGEAFIADQDRVMQTVQELRQRAQAAGALTDTPQQRVIIEDQSILIEPVRPDVVYVPTYDPLYVYGPWWAPAYQPFFWHPPRVYYSGPFVSGPFVAFGVPFYASFHHWGWARPDWRSRHIAIDLGRRNYFIERRPYYREWVRDGWWQHRGDGWRGPVQRGPGQRDVRPRDGYRPPSARFAPGGEHPPRLEGRPGPLREGYRPPPARFAPGGEHQGRVETRPGGPPGGYRPPAAQFAPGADHPARVENRTGRPLNSLGEQRFITPGERPAGVRPPGPTSPPALRQGGAGPAQLPHGDRPVAAPVPRALSGRNEGGSGGAPRAERPQGERHAERQGHAGEGHRAPPER